MSRGSCAIAKPARAPRLLACWLVVLATACSEAPQEPPPPAFTVTDSAGVRVVVNSGQQWGKGEGWQVTAEPVVTLGVRDYPVEQQFERLGRVEHRIVVEPAHPVAKAFPAAACRSRVETAELERDGAAAVRDEDSDVRKIVEHRGVHEPVDRGGLLVDEVKCIRLAFGFA